MLADESARGTDGYAAARLVLAPDVADDAGNAVLDHLVLDLRAGGYGVVRVDGSDEGDGDLAAVAPAVAEELRHHLGDVAAGHHPLGDGARQAEVLRELGVGVDGGEAVSAGEDRHHAL